MYTYLFGSKHKQNVEYLQETLQQNMQDTLQQNMQFEHKFK